MSFPPLGISPSCNNLQRKWHFIIPRGLLRTRSPFRMLFLRQGGRTCEWECLPNSRRASLALLTI